MKKYIVEKIYNGGNMKYMWKLFTIAKKLSDHTLKQQTNKKAFSAPNTTSSFLLSQIANKVFSISRKSSEMADFFCSSEKITDSLLFCCLFSKQKADEDTDFVFFLRTFQYLFSRFSSCLREENRKLQC